MGTEICRDYLKGVCFRSNCRYAHTNADGSSGVAKTHVEAQGPQSQPICRDYENGRCFRTSCRFYHRPAAEIAASQQHHTQQHHAQQHAPAAATPHAPPQTVPPPPQHAQQPPVLHAQPAAKAPPPPSSSARVPGRDVGLVASPGVAVLSGEPSAGGSAAVLAQQQLLAKEEAAAAVAEAHRSEHATFYSSDWANYSLYHQQPLPSAHSAAPLQGKVVLRC
eukprot:jgi/Chlat1/7148/Chrsp57S06826